MILDVRAAARLLGAPEEQVYRWAEEGVLPVHRIGEQLRFSRVELLEWAAARRVKVAHDVFAGDERPSRGPAFSVARALEAGGIHRDVAAADEAGLLRAVGELLPLPDGMGRETARALFAARQDPITAQHGIAIPHARSPAVARVREPALVLALLARPVPLGAPDGIPVHAVFALLSPSIRGHLGALAGLASALSDAALRALIERRAPDAQLLARVRALEADEEPREPAGEGLGAP